MQQRYGDTDIYKGLTLWAPNINIFRDPRWGRGHETYGEDPWLTSRLGIRYIRGLQGSHEKYLKTAACVKHFAVHSGPEELRHSFDAEVSEKDLRETYLPAFEACVKDGDVEAVMGAYNRVNGVPCLSLIHIWMRKAAAKELTAKIKAGLTDLNFIDVEFSMEFTRLNHFTANGYDEAEFMISTNPGESVKPLGTVASGGELSRICLLYTSRCV